MDIAFLRKFIPYSEMKVIMDNLEAYRPELERTERQIRALPMSQELNNLKLDEINIGMHYFGGACDWWVYALEPDLQFAEAYVCLGDPMNAESGPVYIPELLPIAMVNLDLHWKADTKLVDIINRVQKF